IEPVEGAVETQVPRFGGACDRVLVDAPCSNLGVLRRNPDAKWRRGATDLALNAERQARILEAAAALVKPGGRLVYATCSLEPEENDDVARGFLAAHPEFRPDPPGEFPLPLDPDGTLRCLPHHHGTDGFTAVRFRRSLTRGITAPCSRSRPRSSPPTSPPSATTSRGSRPVAPTSSTWTSWTAASCPTSRSAPS